MARSSAHRTNKETQRRSPRKKTAPQIPRPARHRHDQKWETIGLPAGGRNSHGMTGAVDGLAKCELAHTISSYLYPQQFLKNKSGHHRQDKKQPDPIHPVTGNLYVAIRIVDGDRFDRTSFRERRFRRRPHPVPELSTQPNRRDSWNIISDAHSFLSRLAAGDNRHYVFSGPGASQAPDNRILRGNVYGRSGLRNLLRKIKRHIVQAVAATHVNGKKKWSVHRQWVLPKITVDLHHQQRDGNDDV